MEIVKREKKHEVMTCIVLGLYIILLTWLVLFKFSTDFTSLGHHRSINLIPYSESMLVNGKISLSEILYNILVFVPLGVYVVIVCPKLHVRYMFIPGLVLSLLYETLQYVFAIGASDITDVIGNTLGGIIGVAFCLLLRKVLKKHYVMLINGIGLGIEAFAIVMLTLVFLNN